MKRLLTAGLALCICAGLVVGTAFGAAKSKVSGENTAYGSYEGKVKSPRGKCEKNRRVIVWHDTNGNGVIDSPPDFKIGETTTDGKGNWKLEGEEQPPGGAPDLIFELKRKKGCRGDTATATAKPFPPPRS